VAKTTSSFDSDRAIRQYSHDLLLESQFVPSTYRSPGCTGKSKAKMAVSVATEAKPEVEIWRRPKKSTFWPHFSYSLLQTVLARTYRFATIQNVTDRQTTQCTKGATDSTVGQKRTQEGETVLCKCAAVQKCSDIFVHWLPLYFLYVLSVSIMRKNVINY